MDLEEYAKDQLSYTYARIASDQDTRSKIKNWCVTVWVGSLAAVGSSRLTHLTGVKMVLPFLPIVFFWILDGIYQVFISTHSTHARKLEEMLLGLTDITPETLRRISLESGPGRDIDQKLVKQILYAFFRMPTVVSFYILLIVVTALFYGLVPS